MDDSDSSLSSTSQYSIKVDTPPPMVFEDAERSPANSWETIFVYAFATKFCGKLIEYPPQDFEQALSEPRSDLLEVMLLRFLGNALDRKKPIERGGLNRAYADWAFLHKNAIASRTGKKSDIPVPSLDVDFFEHDALDRLTILKELIESQLQHSPYVKELISANYTADRDDSTNPLVFEPFGHDSEKIHYYSIGDYPRLWAVKDRYKRTAAWQPVCTTLVELQQLAIRFGQIKKRPEKELFRYIMEDLMPRVEAEELRLERRRQRERRAAQMAAQVATRPTRTPRLRERRAPVRYYEEYDDDSEDGNRRRGSEKEFRQGSRRSSRRNASGGDTVGDDSEDWQSVPPELKEGDHNITHEEGKNFNGKTWSNAPPGYGDSISVSSFAQSRATSPPAVNGNGIGNGHNHAQVNGVESVATSTYDEAEFHPPLNDDDDAHSDFVDDESMDKEDRDERITQKRQAQEYMPRGTTTRPGAQDMQVDA